MARQEERSRSPRGLHEELEVFIREYNLDQGAAQTFRSQPEHVQRSVLDAGPISGGGFHGEAGSGPIRNASAILMGRIRKALAERPRSAVVQGRLSSEMVLSEHQTKPSLSQEISWFVTENNLDETAERTLLEESVEVQERVLQEGSLTGARNTTGVLISRIKRIKQGAWLASGSSSPAVNGPSTWSTLEPMSWGPSPSFDPIAYDALVRFIHDNGIESNAATTLMEAPEDVQERVLQEGPIKSRNPSSSLLSRIFRIHQRRGVVGDVSSRSNTSSREPVKGAQRVIHGGSQSSRWQPGMLADAHAASTSAPWLRYDSIQIFVQENQLDSSAEATLRQAPEEVQARVLQEGPLTGRNPNAVLLSRIRRIQGTVNEPPIATPVGAWSPSGVVVPRECSPFSSASGQLAALASSALGYPPAVPNGVMTVPPHPLQPPPPTTPPPVASLGARWNFNAGGSFEPPPPHTPPPIASLGSSGHLSSWVVGDPVSQFIEDNGIDGSAASALRSAPPSVVQKVLEEGALTNARNPNAMLVARIRRLQDGGVGFHRDTVEQAVPVNGW